MYCVRALHVAWGNIRCTAMSRCFASTIFSTSYIRSSHDYIFYLSLFVSLFLIPWFLLIFAGAEMVLLPPRQRRRHYDWFSLFDRCIPSERRLLFRDGGREKATWFPRLVLLKKQYRQTVSPTHLFVDATNCGLQSELIALV